MRTPVINWETLTTTFCAGRYEDGPEIVIDIDDRPMVFRHTWGVVKAARSKTLYARTTINGQTLLLHRMVMKAESGQEVDHIDGNGLNNSKSNLRFVPHSENMLSAYDLPGRYQKQFSYKNTVRARLKDGTVRSYVYDRRQPQKERGENVRPQNP
jgi:hypothetical protein